VECPNYEIHEIKCPTNINDFTICVPSLHVGLPLPLLSNLQCVWHSQTLSFSEQTAPIGEHKVLLLHGERYIAETYEY